MTCFSTYYDIVTIKVENVVHLLPFFCLLSTYPDIIVPNMESKPKFTPNPSLKLMDQIRETLRYHHYAYRTETSYCHWILRYIYFYDKKKHPKDLNSKHVERFLSNLATEGKVAASTQRQALNAIVFLYRDVLDKPLDGKIAPVRSKRKPSPPTVLTQEEVKRSLQKMNGTLPK